MSGAVTRKLVGIFLLAAATLIALLVHSVNAVALRHGNFVSGWFLIGFMVFLLAFNLYKRIPFLPVFTARTWLQGHIYVGLLTVVIFLCHVGFRWPSGILECALAAVFAGISVSGVIGLFISRTFARRLTARGSEVLYERIPTLRRQLQEEAERISLAAVADAEATAVGDFYLRELRHYFARPRFFAQHLLESRRPLLALQAKMDAEDRYLDESEREAMSQLRQLARQKFDLDYAYALQSLLKWWLFVHIPLSYCIFVLILLHIIVVYAFYSGIR